MGDNETFPTPIIGIGVTIAILTDLTEKGISESSREELLVKRSVATKSISLVS